MFERQNCGGVISFITGSSYLKGPAFLGMRRKMREELDEIWIIDLGGEGRGARRTPNVFAIKTPVAIAVCVRKTQDEANGREKPARVHYTRIDEETRERKLEKLDEMRSFEDFEWTGCSDDWEAPFLPKGQGQYFNMPLLSDLFPWQHSGVKFGRTWPVGETKEVLEQRWMRLADRTTAENFKNTRDRRVDGQYNDLNGNSMPLIPENPPIPRLYDFRAFDRHWCLLDNRLGDNLRPVLWQTESNKNMYLTTLLRGNLGTGPGMMISSTPPDMHHFRGSFGGKDVIPLYKDANSQIPNITKDMLSFLGTKYGMETPPTPEKFTSYVYAVMSIPIYVEMFYDEIGYYSLRVPITKDGKLFDEIADEGRELIHLHTYGERFGNGEIPQGRARCIEPILAEPYPNEFHYENENGERMLCVESGRIGPVEPEIWEFEISGLKVVQSWLRNRMFERGGVCGSPLNTIRPERWNMTEELLNMLWILEATVMKWPNLKTLFQRVMDGECFDERELPKPINGQERAPRVQMGNRMDI